METLRDAAIVAAFESAEMRLCGMTLNEFAAHVAGWECHPVQVDGRVAGAVLVNGNEIHACVMPWAKGRWMSRRFLAVLRGLVDKYGSAVTSATTAEGAAFVVRLGFVLDNGRYVKAANHGH